MRHDCSCLVAWGKWDSAKFRVLSKSIDFAAEKREMSESQTQVSETKQTYLKIVGVTFN